MTKKRNIAQDAQAAVDAAVEKVIEYGGVVHEDALFDAAEMALDGQPVESIAERIKQERAEAYVPKGGWAVRR